MQRQFLDTIRMRMENPEHLSDCKNAKSLKMKQKMCHVQATLEK